MRSLLKYLSPFLKELIWGPFFKLTEAIFELIVPLVMAKIIDVGIKNGDIGYIFKMGGIMVALGLVGLLCALSCQYLAAKASQGFGTLVRDAMFAKINGLSHSQLDSLGAPSLVNRLTNDINQLQVAVAMLIRLVVRAPFLVIGAAVMAMALDLKLSLVFLAAAPVVAIILYLVMRYTVPLYRKIQKKLDNISLITRENLSGARVVRAFGKEEQERQRFDSASDELFSRSVSVGRVSALLSPLCGAVMNIAIAAILWFGGIRVDMGALSQGQIIAFVNYMTQISLALIVVANLVIIFTRSFASAVRVSEVLNLTPEIKQNFNAYLPDGPSAVKVRFNGVCMRYSGSSENALSDINLDIAAGETVGIIGGTGSGKSSLVSLIPRFYDVSEGEVLLDGENVRDWPIERLRHRIGIVPQHSELLSGTIRESLTMGRKDISDSILWRSIRIAQASEFISSLEDGLDTRVEQGGKNLSGGQRQRLCIARALINSPSVLILDDSSSALDFATDLNLRRALKKELTGTTVVMVSQRVGTVRGADKIVVMDDGRIAGIGKHDELAGSCAEYAEICRSQLSEKGVS